jgi:hypothetical protein
VSQQPPARSWPYLAPISKMRCPGGGLSHSPIRCGSPRSRRAGLRLTLHIALYLAKFYLPGDAALGGVAVQARAGAQEAARAGADVRFVRAIFVPRDESCFALYRAGSVQAVTMAGAMAGLVFDRVAEALTAP